MSPPLSCTAVEPGSFEPELHFYPRVLNAQIHPLVAYFLNLGNERIAERYCHMHPEVQPEAVQRALTFRPKHLRWAGADLFYTTSDRGVRRMVVVEVNSSPSGQKSMPLTQEHSEQGGYRTLMERTMMPLTRGRNLPKGGLAVIYDKNGMEATGYAAALADASGETVYLGQLHDQDPDPPARFDDSGVLEVRDESGAWVPIRAALRYVTQRPWNRVPPVTRTAILNPVLACLAGGRNKLLASKAYEFFNAEHSPGGLHIYTPETIWDVPRDGVPLWVARMGGFAVVKVPYANAGQGVYTITSPRELDAFMADEQRYDRFIVQSLVGNVGWTSAVRGAGRLYHVGTMPDRHRRIYAADLRLMVGTGESGFYPVAIYCRRARTPLTRELDEGVSSWSMLGTNLSVKRSDGGWDTESERLLLVDRKDFNRIGVGLDDLIDGYLQTVLATAAIDEMARKLLTQKGRFRRKLFASMNPDPSLTAEIIT